MADRGLNFLLPPLTTTFTPASECSGLAIHTCYEISCDAYVSAEMAEENCYPNVVISTYKDPPGTYTYPVSTYSPGFVCPLGMTAAATLATEESIATLYCCYSGFYYASNVKFATDYCWGSFTEGTVGFGTSSIVFAPNQTDLLQSVASGFGVTTRTGPPLVGASVKAIVLISPRLLGSSLSSSSLTTIAPTEGINNSSKDEGDARSSTSLQVGVGVGVSVGVVLLVCLGFLFFLRYRRKRLGKLKHEREPAKEEQNIDCEGKRESFRKAELDALAIRAELEGSPGEEHDTCGVGVLKPELQGAPGVPRRIGVYVKRKAELEAPSNLGATPRAGPSAPSLVRESGTNNSSELVELDARSLSHRLT
ncbi:hypothetical protein O1611_g724 [Lasiodiplodia mahajangana]|uniref:Uncharacterized protein n=1 Tax=Lasiodiplodia mahajangana TaxID=1108764 RepID=A0ACC2K083_9PEZI|nr:hypothetical protein O1611_g724 [Lasiodiplodia mahajangana]